MPALVPETYTAPSAWATYLINGDDSGITPSEREAADRFVEWVGCGAPVSCDDAGFRWRHDAYRFCPLGADCQEYTFLRDATPSGLSVETMEGDLMRSDG